MFFDVADFMGNDGVHLLRCKGTQERIGYQDIAEPTGDAHDSRCQHPPPENGPVNDIAITDAGAAAESFDALTVESRFKRIAAPEALDDERCENRHDHQKPEKVDDFALGAR